MTLIVIAKKLLLSEVTVWQICVVTLTNTIF